MMGIELSFIMVGVKCGNVTVSMTPALVPTHSRSLHVNSDVTRKQAALCWRMMSSQQLSILPTVGATFTSPKYSQDKA